MAFIPHALVQFQGVWTATDMTDEVWSFGVRVETGAPTGYQLQDPQQYANDIKSTIATWFGIAGNYFNAAATLTSIKVNNINADGHYADPVTHGVTLSQAGGKTLANWPAYCCVAYTWETGVTSGKARRGRIYPPNVAGVGLSGGASTGDMGNHASAGKTLLATLLRNESVGEHRLVRPCVVSRVGGGTIHDITGVSVNSVCDVQRRRKNRVVGTRTSVAFP